MFHCISDFGLESVCRVCGDCVEVVVTYKFLNLVFLMVLGKNNYRVNLNSLGLSWRCSLAVLLESILSIWFLGVVCGRGLGVVTCQYGQVVAFCKRPDHWMVVG